MTFTLREQRFLARSSNLGRLTGDIWDKNLKGPFQPGRGNFEKFTGLPVAGIRAIGETGDALIADILGYEVEFRGGEWRIARDTRQLLKNIVTLHPLRAASDALRLLGDPFIDIPEALGGFKGQAYRGATRSQIARTLS